MASTVTKHGMKQVKAILSTDHAEAKRRVVNLYKAWYRQLPEILRHYEIQVTLPMCRAKLKEQFFSKRHVQDLRTIDLLVLRSQMDLMEMINYWKQKTHVWMYFENAETKPPTDFLTKFYEGHGC